MSRETSPYVLGDYWIAKRKDGKSPDIWQIVSYNSATRSLHHRSTDCRALTDAIEAIKAFHGHLYMEAADEEEDAPVATLLLQYVDEHASNAISASSLCANIRVFVAFLIQDQIGLDASISQLNPLVFERFRQWRMGPHEYDLRWRGKTYRNSSAGVVGETVSKNLDDVRAALNYAANMRRIRTAPRVPPLKLQYRSPPRSRVLSYDELGAIVGYASFDPPFLRYVLLLTATAVRPEAALKLRVSDQFKPEFGVLDLHPLGAPLTKKHNPVIPVIPEFKPWLVASVDNFVSGRPVAIHSMKRRWRTMRRELRLGPEVISKTIRHTVATYLRTMRAPPDQVVTLLGHDVWNRTTRLYAKVEFAQYDPDYQLEVTRLLSVVWERALASAETWRSKFWRDCGTNANCVVHEITPAQARSVVPIATMAVS